jgi:nitrate/nitrite-specific signal transduction histidine kinase
LALSLNLAHALKPDAEVVFRYVFTEMLNNAIDHSDSKKVRISATLEASLVRARVEDSGIGRTTQCCCALTAFRWSGASARRTYSSPTGDT